MNWVKNKLRKWLGVTNNSNRVLVLEERYEWQPIESAPCDGTLILVRGKSEYIPTPVKHEFFIIAAYYDRFEFRPISPWYDTTRTNLGAYKFKPIEWTPIPKGIKERP